MIRMVPARFSCSTGAPPWLHFSPMVDAEETTVEADAADGLATSGAGNSIGLLRDGSYCVDDIELWTVRRAA